MAQESETAAPMAAPQTMLRQETREGETRFDFHPDRLDYTFSSRQGTRVERRIPWNVVPPLSRLRRTARPDRRFNFILRMSMIALIFFLARHVAVPVGPLPLIVGFAAIMSGMSILLTRQLRIHNAILPTSQGNIVVLGDAAQDDILAQLMAARRAHFRRFATIDRGRSTRWNLHRLRWMLEQDVIGRDEFVRAQQALLPAAPEPLLRPAADAGPDLRIEQRFCNALFAFDFRADHLAYRRRTGVGVENAITATYLDLPEPTTEVQVGAPSELLPYLTLWLVAIGFGYVFEMLGHFPRWYFAGPEGLQRGLIVFAPGIAAVVLAILVARRLMRTVCTKLPQDIFVLCNRQHDAIFAELRRRRLAALKAMAEPDPLLSPEEQAGVLATLRERGVVAAEQIPDMLARATALQNHLGLGAAKPGGDAAIRSEVPAAQPSSRPTIH